MPSRPTLPALVLASLVLMAPYWPSVAAPFDFVDDGSIVYPTPGPFLPTVAARTLNDFQVSGPFRPTTWLRWEGVSRLCGPNALGHRLFHLGWGALSIALFLGFLLEARISWPAALLTAAVAMASPLRNEIWIGMGLTEAFAFPLVMAAFLAALRAHAHPAQWGWDLLGFCAALAALGCKNTFAPIVLVQMFLRLTGGQDAWLARRAPPSAADSERHSDAWQRHLPRALLLGTALALPVLHFLAYRAFVAHKPGAYQMHSIGPWRVWQWLEFMLRAGNLIYVAAGVACWALAWRKADWPQPASAGRRTLLLAGLLLFAMGMAIYLPIPGRSGRYSIPAVWGIDLMLAVAFHHLLALPASRLKWAGGIALACGLSVALATTLLRQDQYHARSRMLWSVFDYLAEKDGSTELTWLGPSIPQHGELGQGEGIHLQWHWQHRLVRPLKLHFVADASPTPERLAQADRVLAGGVDPPGAGPWHAEKTFISLYAFGARSHVCTLWRRGLGEHFREPSHD